MFNKLRLLFLTETGKDTSIIFVGTIINVIAGGLFFIFTPRLLGPENYGLFTLIISTTILATNIANFGIDSGILKFAAREELFEKILSLAFKSYLFLGAIVFLIGFLISPAIASYFNQSQISPHLRIAFTSVIILLLTNFYVAALQVKKEFLKASLLNITSNSLRILILALAAYFFAIGLYFITILFFAAPIVSIVLGRLFVTFKFRGEDKRFVRDFFGYNLWIASSLIIASIPFENYFLLKVAGPIQAGIYAAPFKLLTFVHQFAGNFSRVLANRFASFDTDSKVLIFSKKSSIIVLLFSLLLLLAALVAPLVTRTLFGQEFIGSENVFRILSISFIFFFASTIPISIILYYFGKSKIIFYITLIKIIILILGLALFVEKYQAIGAAFSLLLAESTAFTVATIYSFLKLKR